MATWWESFFDADYMRLWEGAEAPERTEKQVAGRRRGDLPAERLRSLRHDLRQQLPEGGFDVALNIDSSLGYGTEADDLAILSITGRMHTTWFWQGPRGGGQKTGDFRVYSATELVNLLGRAGLRVQSTHDGCSPDPFVAPGANIGGRLGVRTVRE